MGGTGANKDKGQNTDPEKILEQSRRDFLKRAGILGAVSATGAAAIYAGHHYEKSKGKDKMVKVLTEDNRLVEIPVDQIADFRPDLKMLQSRGREGIPVKCWLLILDLAK